LTFDVFFDTHGIMILPDIFADISLILA